MRSIDRRRRFLMGVILSATAFVVAVAGVLWVVFSREDSYRAGDEVEGLTAELARSLPDDYPRVTFQDVTREAGIRFRHFPGRRSGQIPEDMGSGAAWGDFDRDGWMDLFVVNAPGPLTAFPETAVPESAVPESAVPESAAPEAAGEGRAHLYRNLGDGTFEEVAVAAGVDFRGWGMAAAWGDYDGDGWPDLAVSAYRELKLYRNRGDGTFEDVSVESGFQSHRGFWAGISWADYDRDGGLDLYVTGYVDYASPEGSAWSSQYDTDVPASLNPSSFSPVPNLLLRNLGDGTFRDVADEAGVRGEGGRSLTAAWADLNEDGWPDLYVANDVSDNALFQNRGDGTFEEVSHPAMVADYRGAMGIGVGDWDGDGDLDLFVTHWVAQENALYSSLLNQTSTSDSPSPRRMQFRDDADRFGLGQIALDYVGWGTAFFDFDNDGALDLLVVNGSTFQMDERPEELVPMRDQLFWNAGRERGFFDVGPVVSSYFTEEHVGRGAAVADYDNDGDLDLFIVNHSGAGVLLRNEGGVDREWLQLELVGTDSERSGLGAKVRVYVGETAQVLEVGSQPSYLSQNAPIPHFGLGDAPEADSVTVLWPSGARQTFGPVPARVRVRVVEGQEPDLAAVDPFAALPERERTRRFWELYREATGHRVSGEFREAARGYRLALRIDPRHGDALYYLGGVSFDLGEYAAAEEALVRLVEVNPRGARGHARLGALYLCEAPGAPFDPNRATDAYRRAREINPEETGNLLELIRAALIEGRTEEAGRQLKAVLRTNDRSARAYFLRGYLAWSAGDRAAAEEDFRRSVEAARGGLGGQSESGEGDTRSGTAPVTPSEVACRGLAPSVAELRVIVDADFESETAERYAALSERLDGLKVRR